jgi:hypothetical protein
MTESSLNLPTVVDRFHVPVPIKVPAPKPLAVVSFGIDCSDLEEAARLLAPFVDGDQMILPAHPLLTIGDEVALQLALAGTVVLSASCGAIETVGPAADVGPVRVQLLGLHGGASALLERLLFIKRFHGPPGTSTQPDALARLDRLVRPVELPPVPVEGTAILEHADLEEVRPAGSSGPRRVPPPLPPSPAALARRERVLARMNSAPALALPRAIQTLGATPRVRRAPSVRAASLVLVTAVGVLGTTILLWG